MPRSENGHYAHLYITATTGRSDTFSKAVTPKQHPALRSSTRISRATVDAPEKWQQLKLAGRGIVNLPVSV
jgi:hypothetical protein